MTPKRKIDISSSESGSSSSSSSSSCSSGSSSDSSSTDSETSTSEVSSDSDQKKKAVMKKPDQIKQTETQSAKLKAPVDSKTKEAIMKSRKMPFISRTPIYSDSESEENSIRQKSAAQRKAIAKPKSSATVTPAPKLTRQKIIKTSPKKSDIRRNSRSKTPAKEHNDSAGFDTDKKHKSIFSPERPDTPPPPKLTPMKKVFPKKTVIKPRPKASVTLKKTSSTSEKSRTSSVSSSNSSGESPRKDFPKKRPGSQSPARKLKTEKNSHCVSSSAATKVACSSSASRGSSNTVCTSNPTTLSVEKPRGRGRPRKYPLPDPRQSKSSHRKVNANALKIVTRKQVQSTPSSITYVSKLLSSIKNVADTDSDTGDKFPTSRNKKFRPKISMEKKSKNKGSLPEVSQSGLIELEERLCPVKGCNSSGHLGGHLDKHFTFEACPLYHNLTPKQCKENYFARLKRHDERKKATVKLDITSDRKAYQERVKEMRDKEQVSSQTQDVIENSNQDREPELNKCNIPLYDIRLFQEAQAVASVKIEEELMQLPNVRGVKCIEIGKHEMEVWYQSPYPEEYTRVPKLYICEFCLKYMKTRTIFNRHIQKCIWKHPPGEEVYRKDKISVWEVDGKKYRTYSQNLCLLAKFFLDHKTLYHDVEPFLFYIMTICDGEGCHIVGYFSKEKSSFLNFNVSCILTVPPYQRQGYGRLLIDFSYLLTRVEGKVGSPEKPLSDLGLISYRSYWKDVLLERLCNMGGRQISIKDMSQELAINSYDIVSTLQVLGMMKYWKGKHIILKKQEVIQEYMEKRDKRKYPVFKEIDPKCLRWHPPNVDNHSANPS